ncbi:hypothetical protein LZC95_48560 [Pendulispora brunnea]|uniref:Uncharacterized protein n=1 Tax=Pendulispora brunnea TaxID=2905690 RepID=A0ABZ2K6H0_9BACT
MAASVVTAPPAKAKSLHASSSDEEFLAQDCERVRHEVHWGRNVNTWQCDLMTHGQVSDAQKGDSVWLADWPEGVAYVKDGWNYADTPGAFAVGQQTCARLVGLGGTWCN